MRELLFVSCTEGIKEDTVLYLSLQKLAAGEARFFENNREGLSTCYNRVLDELASSNNILVLVHDDVTIADAFLREKLNEAIERLRFHIVGLAGSASFNLQLDQPNTMWLRVPAKDLSGAVEHRLADGSNHWSFYGVTPRPCIVLDGLFLAVDLRAIGPVRFDPQFAFHFYDLDFCLTAHQAGLKMGTTNVYVNHRSGGCFAGPDYLAAQERFRRKWQSRFKLGT